MRVTRVIDATVDEVESAKESAIALVDENTDKLAIDLFYTDKLNEVEQGIKRLNDFSNKSWLVSAILLYTLIYDKKLYQQSGLDWQTYSQQSRERLGMDNRDITDQLASARFFIKHHKALEKAGFEPTGMNRKLSRAEYALDLSKNEKETIKHIVNDTWKDFYDWYQSFKPKKSLPLISRRDDLKVKANRFYVNNTEAVTISKEISKEDREMFQKYLSEIFEALSKGYEVAVVPVYDKKEAKLMERLRDKHRQGR